MAPERLRSVMPPAPPSPRQGDALRGKIDGTPPGDSSAGPAGRLTRTVLVALAVAVLTTAGCTGSRPVTDSHGAVPAQATQQPASVPVQIGDRWQCPLGVGVMVLTGQRTYKPANFPGLERGSSVRPRTLLPDGAGCPGSRVHARTDTPGRRAGRRGVPGADVPGAARPVRRCRTTAAQPGAVPRCAAHRCPTGRLRR